MIVFFFLTLILLIYMSVIAIIVRKTNNNQDLIIIPPPNASEVSNKDSATREVIGHLKNDRYLNAIAELLLDQANEPFKIVKFIDTMAGDDKEFILAYLKTNNLKLHDIIVSLLGIDTENIPEFESEDINTDEPESYDNTKELSSIEDLLFGGIPYKFLQENPLDSINTFSACLNKINETYIARVLSDEQKQQIDQNGMKLLQSRSTHTPTKIMENLVKASFAEGKQIAKDIIEESKKDNS